LTELLIGKAAAEIEALRPADIENAVGGLASESKHAALLTMDAVRAVLAKK
jgi:hypothetical protein